MNQTARWIFWGIFLSVVGACHADPLTNLLVNSGFETGNFSGWTESGNVTPCVFVGTAGYTGCIPTTSLGPHSGRFAAELGNYGADGYLSQTVATTAGASYDLMFWLASQAYGAPSNDFSVTWAGQQLLSAGNLGPFGYTAYSFSGLTATSSSTTLTFAFHNDPSYFALDDVSLTRVPEPGTLALFAGALALLWIGRRKWLRLLPSPPKV